MIDLWVGSMTYTRHIESLSSITSVQLLVNLLNNLSDMVVNDTGAVFSWKSQYGPTELDDTRPTMQHTRLLLHP